MDDSGKIVCPASGLEIITVSKFMDISVSKNLRASFRKIGDSIVFVYSKGDQSTYNTEELIRFNTNVEEFCRASGVKMPFVEVHDLTEVKGRHPYSTVRAQVEHYKVQQNRITGVVTINISSWFMQVGLNAVGLFKPDTKFVFCTNYKDAVTAALKITRENRTR